MSQTDIFRKKVFDHMDAEIVTVGPETFCNDVVDLLTRTGDTAVMVVAPDGKLSGILTEHDVVNRMIYRTPPETPIRTVMSNDPMTVRHDDFLYHAIARMLRSDYRHLPVVDADGAPVGLITLDEGFAAAFREEVDRIDQLTQEGTVDGLRRTKAAEVSLAEELFQENVRVPDIQSVLTQLNHDIHRQVIQATERSMSHDGHGPPPVEYCFIIMGSGGRGENFIYPDQDNGIILADYPDEEHPRVDAWFIEFAERVCRDLDAIGFPYCKGFVMATNPLWRKSLNQWREQIDGWCRRRNVVALRLADIFFDFAPVAGDDGLGAELRTYLTEKMKVNPAFLQEMQKDAEDAGVALGWFNRFITEKTDPEHLGELNLKSTGTIPMVDATRLLALREGIPDSSTRGRLDALAARGLVEADEHDYLRGAFRLITMLLLRQQIADFKAGRAVSNYVDPGSLSRRERDMLVNAFKAIRKYRDRVRADFTGDVF